MAQKVFRTPVFAGNSCTKACSGSCKPRITTSNRFSLLSEEEKIGVEPPPTPLEATHIGTGGTYTGRPSKYKPLVWDSDLKRVQASKLELGSVAFVKDSVSVNQKRKASRRKAPVNKIRPLLVPPKIEEVSEDSDSNETVLQPVTAQDILSQPDSDCEESPNIQNQNKNVDFHNRSHVDKPKQFYIRDPPAAKSSKISDDFDELENELNELFAAANDLIQSSLR